VSSPKKIDSKNRIVQVNFRKKEMINAGTPTLLGDRTQTELRKYTIELTDEQVAKIKRLADQQGITANALLQSAINTEEYIRDQIKAGNKILVQTPDNQFYQLNFR